ncbi:MAG: LacI family DNA-binding transcriptional regulator [Propionibacteriaceae bacterium]|nr:LacI family DNA-binding transcriptional regulator [Propionibacteriaceae bacterium]
MRRDKLSMREVAELARVSLGTVSNVVNNPDRVLPETRRRVEEAIKELGWVPNLHAKELRAGRSTTVGLAVMDVVNPFFADLLRGAQHHLEVEGLNAIIGDADNRPEREAAVLRSFRDQRVAGVILGPIRALPPEAALLGAAGIPVVLVDRADSETYSTVGVDDVAGGDLAGRHLIERGHRSLAFIGGSMGLAQVRDRLAGFRRAVADGGGTLRTLTVDALDFASGRQAADQFERWDRPTAAFCANDMLAIGLLQGLLARGLRVPEDVAIVGYDDIDFAAAAAVPLSSVAQPRRELGRAAAQLLLAEIAGGGHQHVEHQPTLVVRESS